MNELNNGFTLSSEDIVVFVYSRNMLNKDEYDIKGQVLCTDFIYDNDATLKDIEDYLAIKYRKYDFLNINLLKIIRD